MCDCDDYGPELYECREVKGRKEHKCDECLRTIAKGETHEYANGLWDGEFSAYRTCSLCAAMRDEIELRCYCHGQIMDAIDKRDYPEVQSVADFFERRNSNYSILNLS